MKRSEKIANSAFRHLLGAILAIGATVTEATWGTALLLSNHTFMGFVLAVLTCATATLAVMIQREAWRLWKFSEREAEAERAEAIRPKIRLSVSEERRNRGLNNTHN